MRDTLDEHGQPRPKYNAHSNTVKALNTLLGLCSGLVADKRLNQLEITALDAWLRNQTNISEDPDVIDILDVTSDILKDGIATQGEIDDLKDLIETVLEYRNHSHNNLKSTVNRLLGIVHGISADNKLNEMEVKYLHQWMTTTEVTADTWPCNILHQRTTKILHDGIITQTEMADLLETLNALLGGNLQDTGINNGLATRLPIDDNHDIEFNNRTFCLTGKFIYGSRNKCQIEIKSRGGLITKNITQKLNYLIIGGLASRDWAHTSHGRKIEKAISYREVGHPVKILAEERWIKLL